MKTTGQIRAELPPELDEGEREALVALALRLEATRPSPSTAFREELRQRLLPRRLPPASRLAAAYAVAGSLLLALAAAGLAGIGPFGAG